MKPVLILAACLIPFAHCAAQEAVDKLLSESSPAIQAQLEAIDRVIRPVDGLSNNVEALREIQKLKELTDDKAELVKQVAIFSFAPGPETQPMTAGAILYYMQIPRRVTIRTLAPYLDSQNPQLRSFVRDFFHGIDKADSGEWASVNYKEYLHYVRWSVSRDKEIPAPFIKYIYERSPGRALLVFASASGSQDLVARLQLMRETIEARQQGKEAKPQHEKAQQLEERQKVRSRARRQIELAEHIISDAIWLNKRGYIVRFEKALPEAEEALALLIEGEWWARLYVVHIMRRNPRLLKDNIMRQLREDENELVREATQPPRRQ
jgi:hypothetical protein